MAEPYVGEIRMFAGAYAPREWAPCDGRLLAIKDYESLFALIGTTYGGDGVQSFGVPDLQGRIPIGKGQGPGLRQNYVLGEQGGVEEVTLVPQQLPAHNHSLQASKAGGNNPNPANNVIGSPPAVKLFKGRESPSTKLPPAFVEKYGGNQPHENRMPFVTITYIIALVGIYPSQD